MKDIKSKLREIPGKKELYFFVESDKLQSDIRFIQSEKIENIALNPFHGYKFDNIDWLSEIPFIKKAELGGCYDINFDGLRYLTDLQYLSFNAMKNQKVDLSNLKKLKYLSFQSNKNIKGLEELKELQNLAVSKGEMTFFTDYFFKNYTKLHMLSIADSRLPESLSFLKVLTSLTHLEISYIKSKVNLCGLLEISHSLEILKLSHSKKIESIDTIKKLKKLKTFSIVDSVTLEDTGFVNQLPKLEILIVLGSSYFKNGDLSDLKGRLKHVSIDNKKHYNLKYEDLRGYFEE